VLSLYHNAGLCASPSHCLAIPFWSFGCLALLLTPPSLPLACTVRTQRRQVVLEDARQRFVDLEAGVPQRRQ
jgi:hypothetical protein